MSQPRVLSVGQCGFDHGLLSRHLQTVFGARVERADTHAEALQVLAEPGAFALVLVNRVGDRDGAPGLTLIERLKTSPATASVPVMLVSNYADAQAEAQQHGALAGFGKAEIGRPEVDARIAAALAQAGSAPGTA